MSQRVVRPLGRSYSRALALACSIGVALLSIVCLLRLTRSFAGALETRMPSHNGFHRGVDWQGGRSTAVSTDTYVSAGTGSDVTGTGSMTAPFATIGYAISQTYAGGTVYVAQGVYTENLRLEKALNLLGGYDASNWSTRSLAPYSTIIHGASQHGVLEIEVDGEQGSLIEGFTIVYGYQDDSGGGGSGGGVCLAGSAPVRLSANWILSNTADEDGGGIYVGESSGTVVLSGNTILRNRAGTGGGIYVGESSGTVVLSGNTILHNRADTGGGIYVGESSGAVVLNGNTILRNRADTGGGIAITGGVVTAQNDVIADNESPSSGAGVDVLGGTLVARHWTLANNGYFALKTNDETGSAILTNTIVAFHEYAGFSGRRIVADHTLSDRHHCGSGALCTNIITGNPNYVNPAAGDYHIGAGSAAQDAGVNVGVTTDVDGDFRPVCYGYDVGADELMLSAPAAGFVSSSPGWVNRPVIFTNTTVVTGCASYLWDLGDGSTSTLTNPAHLYTNPGRYTVTLTATNDVATSIFVDAIVIYSPPATVAITGPPVGIINATYTLTATVTPPTTTLPITYRWQSTGVPQTRIVSNTTDTAFFTWSKLGSHAVTVTANNAGATVSRTHIIFITAARFPFRDNFSSGALGGGWSVITTENGRVRVSNRYEPPTPPSDYAVLLDDGVTDQISSTASLILTIDLTGQNGVVLDFWWRDFANEPDPQDGVFISADEGSTWHPVFLFYNCPLSSFCPELVYLDAQVAHYGLGFNSHFQIKFQFFGNRPIEDEDGYAIADVRVRSVPVGSVEVNGHSAGSINTFYTFTAVAGPPTATLPITFTWEATDQMTRVQLSQTEITDTVDFAWNTPGTKVVTATASNAADTVSDTRTISVTIRPDSVDIEGPTGGVVGQSYSFTAEVRPITTGIPVTYTWEAPDWTARAHLGGITDTATFSWSTAGMKVMTVTAANAGGTAHSTHAISIGVPITGVSIAGPETGAVNTTCTFTATVSPITAALPIFYEWSPQPLAGQGSPVVTYRWSVTGLQTITVRATNAGGVATASHTITIDRHKVYLPLVLENYCWPGQWCSQNDQNLTGAVKVFALVACSDGTLFAGTDDGIYRRDPGAWHWQREMSVSEPEQVRSLAANSDCTLVYAAVLNRGVFRRDSGSWSEVAGSEEGMAQAGTVALAGNKVLAGGNFGVRYARIGEEHNWERPEFCSSLTVFSLAKSSGQIYAAVWGDGVCYCDEGDLDRWFSRNECLLPDPPYNGIYARYAVASGGIPALLGTLTGFYRWDPGKQCGQDNGGWDQIGQVQTFWFIVDGTTVYAAQKDGVLRSTDAGSTWVQMNTGWVSPPPIVHTLLMRTDGEGQQWLYAGTNQGVWRYLLP